MLRKRISMIVSVEFGWSLGTPEQVADALRHLLVTTPCAALSDDLGVELKSVTWAPQKQIADLTEFADLRFQLTSAFGRIVEWNRLPTREFARELYLAVRSLQGDLDRLQAVVDGVKAALAQ
jgi:hypothetical protein